MTNNKSCVSILYKKTVLEKVAGFMKIRGNIVVFVQMDFSKPKTKSEIGM